ncbi:MAG: sigma-70 family RNA polymerase sigma factor [Dehalococcoidia bacterium]|nr:sigma-70 family RNA polymerase sigma factor [Dehalococcoidia bacterium]
MITTTRPPIEDSHHGEAESRLKEYRRLIHDACFRACKGGHHGLDMDDMVQEASLKVWKALQKHPDANNTFIWTVAHCAALSTLRRNRRSVDRPLGGTGYEVVSWESLVATRAEDDLDSIQDAMAKRWRRVPLDRDDPTQDIALANIMREELEPYLVPRERQAFLLLLREYQAKEIADVLGISGGYAQRLVMGIRIKAAHLWEIKETRVDPSLATRKCYERNKAKYNANRRERRKGYDPN